MAIIIREFGRLAHDHVGQASVMARGVLLTDETASPIKVVAPTVGGTDSPPLTGKTHWVELENTGTSVVTYAIRPKGSTVTLAATANHRKIPAGGAVMEAVHPRAVINFVG